MRQYSQKVRFERTFNITAKDAESANAKLQELVERVEFDGDVRAEGVYDFEDEDPEEDQ